MATMLAIVLVVQLFQLITGCSFDAWNLTSFQGTKWTFPGPGNYTNEESNRIFENDQISSWKIYAQPDIVQCCVKFWYHGFDRPDSHDLYQCTPGGTTQEVPNAANYNLDNAITHIFITQFTSAPTSKPTEFPTSKPTEFTSAPTSSTTNPTQKPTSSPTQIPTNNPTISPTKNPTSSPTHNPSINPTFDPTKDPTTDPTKFPSKNPTKNPSKNPSKFPTKSPSISPTIYKKEGEVSNGIKTTIILTKNGGVNTKNEKGLYFTSNMMIIIIVLVVILCFMCCCIIYIISVSKKHKKHKSSNIRTDEPDDMMIRICSVSVPMTSISNNATQTPTTPYHDDNIINNDEAITPRCDPIISPNTMSAINTTLGDGDGDEMKQSPAMDSIRVSTSTLNDIMIEGGEREERVDTVTIGGNIDDVLLGQKIGMNIIQKEYNHDNNDNDDSDDIDDVFAKPLNETETTKSPRGDDDDENNENNHNNQDNDNSNDSDVNGDDLNGLYGKNKTNIGHEKKTKK